MSPFGKVAQRRNGDEGEDRVQAAQLGSHDVVPKEGAVHLKKPENWAFLFLVGNVVGNWLGIDF